MKTIPIITVDLELAPQDRWSEVPRSILVAAARLAEKQKAMDPTGGLLGLGLRTLTKIVNPYRDDIKAWASLLGMNASDLYLGNFSYEPSMTTHVESDMLYAQKEGYAGIVGMLKERIGFACTSGAAWSEADGMVHLRTLDWCFPALGKSIVVYHMINAPGGDFYNISFPGYVGVLTAMAPGRFSASINYGTPNCLPTLDWPPSHLLRHVFEQCADYDEALRMLEETPTGTPALITLVGTKKNQSAIIECLTGESLSHSTSKNRSIAIANDYLSGKARDERNGLGPKDISPWERAPENDVIEAGRRNAMLKRLNAAPMTSANFAIKSLNSFPIRNDETKLQAAMAPRTGSMTLYGIEDKQRVSKLVIP